MSPSTPPAAFTTFVARLLAPRPTFPQDMTPEEGDLMKAHVEHWMPQLQSGALVVFGPVMDPKGAWGLAVIEAKDEASVRVILDGDPIVRANRGFRYELAPMARALTRG